MLSMNKVSKEVNAEKQNKVIGFLMYSLLSRARADYAGEITTLSYFGLTLDIDGTIRKLNSDVESEPGWHALSSGAVDTFLYRAKAKGIELSLVVFSGNNDDIEAMLENPVTNARNLTDDVLPVMDKYGFTNLNLDIEATREASPEAQKNFIQFARMVRDDLRDHKKTLTIDVTTLDVINERTLIRPQEVAKIADSVILMAYDYHSTGSSVTGPVAPLQGAGTVSEYDAVSAVQNALHSIPKEKLYLGVPLYGYEWETLGNVPRSAIIPNTGYAASNRRAEKLLSECASCSAEFDEIDSESYVVYSDPATNTYHQLFYPTEQSTKQKVALAETNNLAGLALWALGYEGDSILKPLRDYIDPLH